MPCTVCCETDVVACLHSIVYSSKNRKAAASWHQWRHEIGGSSSALMPSACCICVISRLHSPSPLGVTAAALKRHTAYGAGAAAAASAKT